MSAGIHSFPQKLQSSPNEKEEKGESVLSTTNLRRLGASCWASDFVSRRRHVATCLPDQGVGRKKEERGPPLYLYAGLSSFPSLSAPKPKPVRRSAHAKEERKNFKGRWLVQSVKNDFKKVSESKEIKALFFEGPFVKPQPLQIYCPKKGQSERVLEG